MIDKKWFEKTSEEYWKDFFKRERKKAGEHRFDVAEPPPPEQRKSKAEYARKNREELARSNPSYQYPSITVSRTVKGDIDYAARFRGDADNLLYKVKSVMAHDRPGQFSGERHFDDGTVIKAVSIVPVVGDPPMDFINIDVSRSTISGEGCICSITLINAPTIVQPMRYPEQIHAGEVEGVDYIKTYYTVEKSGGACGILDWTVCDTEELQLDVGFVSGGTQCIPFKYTE